VGGSDATDPRTDRSRLSVAAIRSACRDRSGASPSSASTRAQSACSLSQARPDCPSKRAGGHAGCSGRGGFVNMGPTMAPANWRPDAFPLAPRFPTYPKVGSWIVAVLLFLVCVVAALTARAEAPAASPRAGLEKRGSRNSQVQARRRQGRRR
jgi:hypothetical protein